MDYDYKQDFPLFAGNSVIYFDNSATAQRPQCVLDAEMDFYRMHNANPLRGSYPLSVEATELYEEARKTVQHFIHAAHAEEIIFTRNSTESLNLVAYSYALSRLGPGDEILTTILEHHSNMLPWQMAAGQTGATLRYIDCEPDGSLDMNRVAEMINPKTKLVAVTQVSNVVGRVNPIKEIAELAHANGAVIVVDGAQSVPHMAVDVQELDADFLVFSGHKVFGPMGIGVLYGKRDLLDSMPPFLTGGEMIESVTRTGAVYAELPHKFEAGTVNAAGAVGLAAAIRYVQSIGFDTMQQRELAVTERVLKGLQQLPHVHIIGSDRAEEHTGIISFTVDQVHPHDISEVLISENIAIRAGHHCAQPLLNHLGICSSARASLMFYNTVEEADAFVACMSTLRERMGYAD